MRFTVGEGWKGLLPLCRKAFGNGASEENGAARSAAKILDRAKPQTSEPIRRL